MINLILVPDSQRAQMEEADAKLPTIRLSIRRRIIAALEVYRKEHSGRSPSTHNEVDAFLGTLRKSGILQTFVYHEMPQVEEGCFCFTKHPSKKDRLIAWLSTLKYEPMTIVKVPVQLYGRYNTRQIVYIADDVDMATLQFAIADQLPQREEYHHIAFLSHNDKRLNHSMKWSSFAEKVGAKAYIEVHCWGDEASWSGTKIDYG